MQGLTSAIAKVRQIEFGPNEITREKRRTAFFLFLEQFKSPLVIVLIFACVISFILGDRVDGFSIAAILLLNACIGFFQEYRAENAINALKDMTAPRARVIRDNIALDILARDVVPGDILKIEAGDIIAADAQIAELAKLEINEAILTGESLPVAKAASEKMFMGTSVVAGTALGQVTATGMATELGKIAKLLDSVTSEPTPLQKQLQSVGMSLLIISFGFILLIGLIGFFRGHSGMELLIFSVSLAVAAVPEGLPAIVTVALALGVQRMARKKALVRTLPSVETLGSVSVICTDKTGTLTTGNMRVRELFGNDHGELIRAAVSCCDAEISENNEGIGDSTEVAILIEGKTRGIDKTAIEKSNPRVSTLPFDPERKRMSVYRADHVNYVKGALESLLPLCSISSKDLEVIKKSADDMSARGLRVLAVAVGKTEMESDLHFLGLIGLADPPRTEAIAAIREARAAGITPIMITGDHPKTAVAIAREMGLILDHESAEGRVHARTTPEEKLLLVREWKSRGAIVAMTGDGVNDAPALREAHIGIAMGKAGTEVTRQAADMILADDNFATIVDAVKEGRGIFENIQKAISYLLAGNCAEVFFVLGAVVLGFPLPLLAVHLLWINLVTDSLPALTLIADPLAPDVMQRKPRALGEKILGKKEWLNIVGIGFLEAGICLGLFGYLLSTRNLETARSLIFTTLVFSQLWRSFGARSVTLNFFQVGVFSNLYLLGVVTISAALQISLHGFMWTQKIFGLQQIEYADFKFIIPASLISITVIELTKYFRKRPG